MFCGKILSLLWSFSACIEISIEININYLDFYLIKISFNLIQFQILLLKLNTETNCN